MSNNDEKVTWPAYDADVLNVDVVWPRPCAVARLMGLIWLAGLLTAQGRACSGASWLRTGRSGAGRFRDGLAQGTRRLTVGG